MRLKTWIYSAISTILAVVAIVFIFHFTTAAPTTAPAGTAPAATSSAGTGNGNTDDKGGATNDATGKPGENK